MGLGIGIGIPTGGGLLPAWSPRNISGCVLWLRADLGITKDGSDNVSAWADQSGTGNDLAQGTGANQPLWVDSYVNGKPAILFDGASEFMRKISGTSLSASTVFVVVRFGSLNQGPEFDYALHLGRADTGAQRCCSISRFSDADPDKYYSYDGVAARMGSALTGQAWTVLEQANAGSAPFHSLWKNGTADTVTDYAGAITNTSGSITVGGFNAADAAVSNWLFGHLAEVIIYNSALAAAARAQVRAYLGARYGITVI